MSNIHILYIRNNRGLTRSVLQRLDLMNLMILVDLLGYQRRLAVFGVSLVTSRFPHEVPKNAPLY
jgi:hypothetical protein